MSIKKSKNKRKASSARVLEPRNALFNHPLMKKSHAHEKSNKAKRRAEKVRDSRDWYSQNSFIQTFLRISIHPTDFQLRC